MTTPAPSRRIRAARAITAAIDTLSRDGNYARALQVHHAGSGGRCASCGELRPCSIARLAQKGAEKAVRDARTAAVALGVGDHRDTGTGVLSAGTGDAG